MAPLKDLDLYLQRLGLQAPPPPTLDTLRELQRRHSAAFTFETISTLLHAPVPVDLPSLERKLLHDGRGGYCFELNRLFLALLQRLGFDARALTGRVMIDGDEGTVNARTHLLVLVTIDGVRYTADVGFGGMVPTGPLRLDTDAVQSTPHEPYRLVERDGQYLLRAQVAGEWRGMYEFDLQPQQEIDLEVGSWYVSTHPDSPFLGQLRVARTGPGIRKTLRNGSFAIHRLGAESQRRELPDADAVMQVLRDEFELRLPPGPALREALEARLAADAASAERAGRAEK
ncbi:arylamine N-acetyltransferase family protein [Marilutibacter alkalisoli]|uniref:Arylamine N-acetyltransferase n=1 Tax=Marilutibacter alkalisoli TaxID=2591633 RepID=A0A514BNK9_9GAMM|nr:arylamine N-acetyltransferase [Lysobacter alkalisoli]QDH68962.1 arylamine N-acetyltransferase [Lysobacter alkalisoli]